MKKPRETAAGLQGWPHRAAFAGLLYPASGFNCMKYHRYKNLHIRFNNTEHLFQTVTPQQPLSITRQHLLHAETTTAKNAYNRIARHPGSEQSSNCQMRMVAAHSLQVHPRPPQRPAWARTTATNWNRNLVFRCWSENPFQPESPKQLQWTPFACTRQDVFRVFAD